MTIYDNCRPATAGSRLYLGHAATVLRLAASPVFLMMALLARSADHAMHGAAAAIVGMNGMATMYLLMGAFHLGCWLDRLAGRRTGW